MPSNSWKCGDVVELCSGGPKMTIDGVSNSKENVLCKWFDGNDLKESWLDAGALRRVPEQDA